MNLLELLLESVMAYPDKECLRYKKGDQYHSITYKEFWDTINEVAIGLKASGVKEGDKVGILSTNCPQWTISDYAIMSVGAVVVPIYPTLPASQVEFILNNGDVSCLFVQDAEQLQKVSRNWPQQLQFVVQFTGEINAHNQKVLSFADLCAIGKQHAGSISKPDIHSISEEQLATIVHTSGTSGVPKGVMLSHKNIVSNVQAALAYNPVKETDIALSFLPLSHIFERTVGQFALLSSGATIAYSEGIEKILDNLQEVKPTIFATVPRLLEKVYSKIQQKMDKIPGFVRTILPVDRLIYKKLRKGFGGRLRLIVSGGAALAADIAKFFDAAGIPVYEGYGMTESAPVICANPFGKSRPGTVGRPIPGVKIRVAEDGELLVKGPNVMMGYYKQPEETAKTITEDGWLHTGDVVEIEDGYVKIVDRKKEILVLATGKNVAPGPIESKISLSPYLAQAILIGDNRTYVTCLLIPDFEALRPIANEKQLGEDRSAWVQHPEIRALIREEVIRATAEFAGFERPKRAVILTNELSIEAGELTPKLSVRKKTVLQNYGDRIEAMYNGSGYLPIYEQMDKESSLHIGTETTASTTEGKEIKSKQRPIWLYAAAGIIFGIIIRILV
ncbi:AMP-dependent synthetase/ligase [Effusibacillus consociatus]|uniref:AMP-dependent synthetase/ligase n=1 Tax=Effusibacillus consociatus TaxID=1117041 RepID=A0ABV9PWD5_9BACL